MYLRKSLRLALKIIDCGFICGVEITENMRMKQEVKSSQKLGF